MTFDVALPNQFDASCRSAKAHRDLEVGATVRLIE